MKNSVSEVVMIIIACFLFFLYPIYSFAQKQDNIIQTYVTEETTEFVDMIRNNGYLSKDMYSLFQKKIMQTNNSYEIRMIHEHRQVNPAYSEDGTFDNQVNTFYKNTYEKDILKEIYEKSGIYRMAQGDYICVSIVNKSPTLSSKLQQLFYGRTAEYSIYIRYGGIIRDEAI